MFEGGYYNRHSVDNRFLRIGHKVFESETLIDLIYSVYLTMMTDKWEANPYTADKRDIFLQYGFGYYVPCVERIVLLGEIDLLNDSLPAFASLAVVDPEEVLLCFVRKIRTVPKLYAPIPFTTSSYSLNVFWKDEERKGNILQTMTDYICVLRDGKIMNARPLHFETNGKWAGRNGLTCQLAAATINAFADQRYLWLVKTEENTITNRVKTPLSLGVSKDHVKSLFYARSLPLTETGRKRPILHWVQAHNRRIRSGIDIDIDRYLRGIQKFEMGGFTFEIIQPVNPAK